MKTLVEIRNIKRAHDQELLKKAGVTGVDTGYKYTLIRAKARRFIARSIKNIVGIRGLASGATQYRSVVMQKEPASTPIH